MKKLDKLIKQAKQVQRKKDFQPVHIIENDYCYSCKGKCKYNDNNPRKELGEDVVIIYGDLPDDTNGYNDAPTDTLRKMLKLMGEEEYE
ncbi:MAG: hypothetical protein KID02_10045 [Clostridiales bacterium]|nr:hypothetical protein [Clostridiales bacterium]